MSGQTSRFCTRCGRANESGGNFCESCGADLRIDAAGATANLRPAETGSTPSPITQVSPTVPPPPPPPQPMPTQPGPAYVPAAAAGAGRTRPWLIPAVLVAVVAACLGAWWWLSSGSDSASSAASGGGADPAGETASSPAASPKPEVTATGVYAGKMYGSSYTYDFTMTLEEKPNGSITGQVFEQQIGGNSCSGTEVVAGKRSGKKITLDGKYFTADSACYSRWSGYEDDFELRLSDDGRKISGRYWCYACSTTGPFEMSGRRR